MSINLTHYSEKRTNSNPWIYFGSSYSKMKQSEKYYLGKKIVIQKKIHEEFLIQKNDFLQWIEKQRILNDDSIYWWMTQIAGRNNAYSKFYLYICQLSAIKKFLVENNIKDNFIIVCEDVFLMNLIKKNLSNKFIFTKSRKFIYYYFKDINIFLVKALFSKIKIFITLFMNYVFSKITKPKIVEVPFGKINLFHHCLDNLNFSDQSIMSCKYFSKLPAWFKKKKIKFYGLPWLYNIKPSLKIYQTLRKTNYFIPEDWLNIKDYFNLFLNSFKSLKTLKYNIQYMDINLNSLIFREKLCQLSESPEIFWRYIPAIKKWSIKIESLNLYDQYENMIFEHPLRYIVKKLPLKSTSVGFYHSVVSKEFLPYHSLDSEWTSKIKPDFIACSGKIGENILVEQGTPKSKIINVAALRQNYSLKKNHDTKYNKNILILLSLIPDVSVELLTKINQLNNSVMKKLDINISVKTHPMMDSKIVLQKMKWRNLPDGWQWAQGNLKDELEKSFCSIAMSTASVFDAVLSDNIVISIMSELNLMDNYLDIYKNRYPLVKSVPEEEIKSKIEDVFINKTKEYQDEFKQIRNDFILGLNPVNQKNLDAFIIN